MRGLRSSLDVGSIDRRSEKSVEISARVSEESVVEYRRSMGEIWTQRHATNDAASSRLQLVDVSESEIRCRRVLLSMEDAAEWRGGCPYSLRCYKSGFAEEVDSHYQNIILSLSGIAVTDIIGRADSQ